MSVTLQGALQGAIEVTVNGEKRAVAAQRIDALLRELDYEGNHYAVAVNYDVVPRSRWGETAIKSGDEIEILTARQGG
jgi:sulfur carrier protein